LLLIPRVGFLPYDDPRITGTVAAVQKDLCHDRDSCSGTGRSTTTM
jgi:GH15 family glucan-1,4-alpha-glucosidase